MGGPGSGNHDHWWRAGKKTTVEECLSLDANRWMREGMLRANAYTSGSWCWTYASGAAFCVNYQIETADLVRPSMRLDYTFKWGDGEPQSADYHVRLATTRPRFGGLRWWFICPLVVGGQPCERRVGKLYLPPRARYFGCRHCYNLTYTSCQESGKNESLYRSIAARLGCDVADVRRITNRLGKRL